MDKIEYKLQNILLKCRDVLQDGAIKGDKIWLESFCYEFLQFATAMQPYIRTLMKDSFETANDRHVEMITLCLQQITTCITHMERMVKAEETRGGVCLQATREHFVQRVDFCLQNIYDVLCELAHNLGSVRVKLLEHNTFVEYMDLLMDSLRPYSSFDIDDDINVAAEHAEAVFASETIRSMVNHVVSHTLAFANVALQEDKKALSALCQKVLRECIQFQEECKLGMQQSKRNDSNRRLKANSVEVALDQLENHINEALLRLIYVCFLDYQRFSIEKLRHAIRIYPADDTILDELIADFDVNIDRTTQIGLFAHAFSTKLKKRTLIRSCLASLEALELCIIPSLQMNNTADLHTEILEQHFNEEIAVFKNEVQKIIDSHAFVDCYYQMLTKYINDAEKSFNKQSLLDIVQMGEFLYEHFLFKDVYHKLKSEDGVRMHLYKRFHLILNECRAVLMCADQVEVRRIIKRFKILHTAVRKFAESLVETSTNSSKYRGEEFTVTSDDYTDSLDTFESMDITPSVSSVLYNNNYNENSLRQRILNKTLRGNHSKSSTLLQDQTQRTQLGEQNHSTSSDNATTASTHSYVSTSKIQPFSQRRYSNVQRKQSLRTAMFKRQKLSTVEKAYRIYREESISLQISDILEQLRDLSSSNTSNSNE